MSDTESAVNDFLAHYGVKGMRWGVRKDRSGSLSPSERRAARKAPQPVTVSTTRTGRLKAKGGTNQPATDEARRTTVTRQKARKSGTQALTNAELQQAVQRMNLEQQFKRLDKPGAGQFVQDFLKNQGKQQANRVGNDLVAEALRKKSKK